MNVSVRLVRQEGEVSFVRAKDGRPLFGGLRFADPQEARRYLHEANKKSASSRWTEDDSQVGREQLKLIF
ncbi:hypothetical protein EPN96_01070 [bacterium]|nr:MAG: hypothetical protein EPN96_01070 [bacterium]